MVWAGGLCFGENDRASMSAIIFTEADLLSNRLWQYRPVISS
jgi:hypothetical protein